MPLRRKLAVCGIFVLGGFVVAAGIIRFVYVMDSSFAEAMNPDVTCEFSCLIRATTPDSRVMLDVTAPAIYWTCVEGCLGVVSACLPVMRPLLSEQYYGNILRSLRSSVRGSKHSSNQSSKDSYNKRRVIWPRRNGGDTSDSSLVGQKHGPACNYTIGGTPMDDIPNPSRNIMIETKIDQGFDIV